MGLQLLALLILSSPVGFPHARSVQVHGGSSLAITAMDHSAAERVRWLEAAYRRAAFGVRGADESVARGWAAAEQSFGITRAAQWVDALPLTVDVLKGGGVTLNVRLRGL